MENQLGAEVQVKKTLGKEGEVILTDMDLTIDRLQPLRNRISSIAARAFGEDPSPLDPEETPPVAPFFVAQRLNRQQQISQLIAEMEDKVDKIEEFI